MDRTVHTSRAVNNIISPSRSLDYDQPPPIKHEQNSRVKERKKVSENERVREKEFIPFVLSRPCPSPSNRGKKKQKKNQINGETKDVAADLPSSKTATNRFRATRATKRANEVQ